MIVINGTEIVGSTTACALLGIDRATLTRWVIGGRLQTLGKLEATPTAAYVFDRAEIERSAADRAAAKAAR